MNPKNRQPLPSPLRRLAAALGLGLMSVGSAHAALATGLNDSEFFLVIVDEAQKASYTKDLGLYFSTLMTDGQADAGYQRFWTLDRSADPYFDKLLDLGSAVNSLKWAVYAVDADGFNFIDGDLKVFTTLEHTVQTGIVNPNYQTLVNGTNLAFESLQNTILGFSNNLNIQGSNPDSNIVLGGDTANYIHNGSIFAIEGQDGYANASSNPGSFPSVDGLPLGAASLKTLNAVGRSSWAYMLTQKDGFDNELPAVVDEFDNLEHDAYWGLAQDPDTGILYLSYTLEAVGLTAAQREFALGIGRTEFGAGFNVRRLDGVAVAVGQAFPAGVSRPLGAATPLPITSAVPEPGTYGLMALGLLAVAAAARRR